MYTRQRFEINNTYNVSDAWYGNVKSEYVINRFETNQNK